MKDYNITVTVRNNYLLTKMRELGIWTAADLWRATGVPQSTLGHYLGLLLPARMKNGEFRPAVNRLADFFRCLPEDLFPPQHLDASLPKNRGEFAVDLVDVQWLLAGPERLALPADERIAEKNVATAISEALNNLTERQMRVIQLRYGFDGGGERTYSEIGKVIGVTRERVRQIELQALRRLRARSQSDVIRDATGELSDERFKLLHPPAVAPAEPAF